MIKDLKDPLGTCNSGLQRAVELGYLIDRARELLCEDYEHRDSAYAYDPHRRKSKVSSERRHYNEADIRDAVHDRTHRTAEDLRLDPYLCQLIGGAVEFLRNIILFIVRDYRPVPRYHLLGMSVELTEYLRTAAEQLSHDL